MPARIALFHVLHMTAESGRAAVADGLESFSLVRTECVSLLGEKLFLVRAENIGHFEPMLVHRSGLNVLAVLTMSSGSNNSSGLVVERVAVSATCR